MSRRMNPGIILLLLCICSSSLSSGWPSIVSSLASSGITMASDDKKKKVPPPTPAPTNCKVTVYKDADYGGDYLELNNSVTNLNDNKLGFGDKIHSIKYEGECKTVTMYEHSDYKGAQYNVLISPESENADLEINDWHDRASSIKIE